MFGAFRNRNYRLYWLGMIGSVTGHQIQLFATLWLVYQMTDSPLYLGLAGGATAAGNLGFTLIGGVMADRVDQRRLIMSTQLGHGLLNFIIGTLALTGVLSVWHILAIAFVNGVVSAFDSPARASVVPRLLEDRKDLMSAIAMSSLIWQSTRIFGPVLAAFLLRAGAVLCFYVNAAGFFAMVAAIYPLKLPTRAAPTTSLGLWSSLAEGVNYVRRSSLFSTLVGITLLNSLFGMSYVYMMPVFARDILQAGTQGFGWLMAAMGTGALIGVLGTSSLGGFKHKGALFLTGSIFFGAFLILFSRSTVLYLSLILVVLTAMSNYLYMVTVQTLMQALVSDEIRGRVMSIYSLVFSLQPLGSLISGAIAQYYGAPLAVSLGGAVVCAFSVFILLASPATRKLKA
ncbi:MAG: MFS transporter [Chloroflexi bacterium]|nr:MFS transporter [Chloroflexota bacterium]